jgi:hypothetical protein
MAIQNYADEVMADGPVGYWRLGEPRGSMTAADETRNHNNGRCEGSVTFGYPGFHGGDTAALFDGTTGLIIVPNTETLNPKRITMEAKVSWNGPTPANDRQRILEKESFGGTTQYCLSVQPDGLVFVELRVIDPVAGTDKIISATGSTTGGVLVTGRETHVVATYDGRVIRIYINGNPDPDTRTTVNTSDFDIAGKWPHPPNDPEVELAIGARIGGPPTANLGHRYFNGLIDELAIYQTVLSGERIRAHYQAQFAEIFQYAAKLVCGKSTGKIVAPGEYFTAVNVHNPTYKTVGLRAKVAVALQGLQSGSISEFHDAELGPDGALEIDCPDIFNPEIFKFSEPIKRGFLKGFVVIESEVELDVVAVYTAVGSEKLVETMHMERVPARRLRKVFHEVCVDFEPPLAVGTQYGAPAGNKPGDIIFTSNGIPVSVYEFIDSSGGATFNVATIGLPPIPFGTGQGMELDYINLEFDFNNLGFVPEEVRFEFLNRTDNGNISINGSSVITGDFSKLPTSIGLVHISVSTISVAGGKMGTVILTGAIKTLRVGGVELWTDNVCARGWTLMP